MHTANYNKTLICLPYAGAGANCFEPLRRRLPEGLQVLEVTLPGRGPRFAEPSLGELEAMAEECWKQIRPVLTRPYALLGHSMGSLLAYLLCHKIRQTGPRMPERLFLSGREAPSVPAGEPFDYLLPYPEFKAKLEGYGGIAPEILHDDEAFAFFEPMIRADFQAVECWQYRPQPKLNIPVTVFSGTEEEMTDAELYAWQQEFHTAVRFEKFEGGHFFIFEHAVEIAQIIVAQMLAERSKNQLSSIR